MMGIQIGTHFQERMQIKFLNDFLIQQVHWQFMIKVLKQDYKDKESVPEN